MALSIAQPASAITINDPAAAAVGGIDNYYDSTNQFPNAVSLFIVFKNGNIPNNVAITRTPPSRSWISAGSIIDSQSVKSVRLHSGIRRNGRNCIRDAIARFRAAAEALCTELRLQPVVGKGNGWRISRTEIRHRTGKSSSASRRSNRQAFRHRNRFQDRTQTMDR